MNATDSSLFAEALDDIEEALNAQEVFEGLFQTQMVAENVKVPLDSHLPNGRQLRPDR
jgi:hypothetical protein